MRLAARRVRSWLDEHPGDSVVLVARRVTPEMAADWERIAAEYGIDTAGRLDVPLSSVPLVRLLLRMIAVCRDDFPRREVLDVLSSPYRRIEAGDGVTAARPDLWDLLSKELLAVSGSDWETRLARPPRRRRAEEDSQTDADGRTEQLALLRSGVRALRASLRPLAEARGHAAFARAVRDLLVREFGGIRNDIPEGERDRRAVEALFAILDDLEEIPDREAPWPGPREGAEGFSALLAAQRLFVGEQGGMRKPGAVILGDAVVLRGVTADRAIVLSVNEDAVPAQLEEDPLLPDDDREELNRASRQPDLPDAMSLRRRNAAEEKLLFSLTAASVGKGIAFSVLRADAAGAARRPSRYLLHLLSRFAGPSVFSEEWETASGVLVERLPRSPFAALEGGGPRSAREAGLRAGRGGEEPPAAAAVPWGRVCGVLSAWAARSAGEGIFPGPGIRVRLPAMHSASALEELARCPYRYFLRHVLRLDPPEEPEEALSLSPAAMGEIAHDMLRRLGRDAAAGKGWGDVAPAALPLPALHGRVDRIDRGPAGEVRVVDYKYRDPARGEIPPDWIRHCLSHQVPVYLAFAASLSPSPPAVSAAFYFLRNAFGIEEAPAWDEVREEWIEALAGWLSLAEAGAFPPLPHHRFTSAGRTSPRYCDSCPFRDHCRVSPVYDGSEIDPAALAARIAREPSLRPVADHRPGKGGPVRESREKAANEFRRDLAVDASAGTGKTSTLVARVTNLFLARPELSPDHVLLLTFTDKAAAEMKARVTEGWERLFAATQETGDAGEVGRRAAEWSPLVRVPAGVYADFAGLRRRVEEMVDAVGRLSVTTFHSFCARVLRSFPAEAGVDPLFEVLSEGAAADAWDAAFRKFLKGEFGGEEVLPEWERILSRLPDPAKAWGVIRRLCLFQRDLLRGPAPDFGSPSDFLDFLAREHEPHVAYFRAFVAGIEASADDPAAEAFRAALRILEPGWNAVLRRGLAAAGTLAAEGASAFDLDLRKSMSRKKFPRPEGPKLPEVRDALLRFWAPLGGGPRGGGGGGFPLPAAGGGLPL